MQTLDVISVNLWGVLISIANLLILFLILKKFLYRPVKKVMEARRAALDEQYRVAAEAEADALRNKEQWENTLQGVREEADAILRNAQAAADRRGDAIVSEAKQKADGIVRRAEEDAELERRKAAEEIKKEIVDVSSALAEKMLEREIRSEDHRALIDSFINEVGDDHGGNN